MVGVELLTFTFLSVMVSMRCDLAGDGSSKACALERLLEDDEDLLPVLMRALSSSIRASILASMWSFMASNFSLLF